MRHAGRANWWRNWCTNPIRLTESSFRETFLPSRYPSRPRAWRPSIRAPTRHRRPTREQCWARGDAVAVVRFRAPANRELPALLAGDADRRVARIGPRTNLQIPTFLRASDANHRAFDRRANPNFVSVLLHPPCGLVDLDVSARLGQFEGVRIADQMLGQFVEADGEACRLRRASPRCVRDGRSGLPGN